MSIKYLCVHFKAFIIKKILEISKVSLYVMTNFSEKMVN